MVELNYFTQIGFIQLDGAAIQATRNTQTRADYRYNWAIDSAKAGYRFDAGEGDVRSETDHCQVLTYVQMESLALKGLCKEMSV